MTLVGGAFAAGSANTINCYIDRDIDAMMRRTSRRPLAKPTPLAVIKPAEALIFGILLGAASTVLLGTLVNWLSAVLADAAILFYVFIYTIGLKRRTPSNIVIGGAAGCFPVLVGWSAVTGTVSLPAVVLFAIIFFWTPPHFWALAMKFKDDYAAASVPMLPVVAPPTVVARKILHLLLHHGRRPRWRSPRTPAGCTRRVPPGSGPGSFSRPTASSGGWPGSPGPATAAPRSAASAAGGPALTRPTVTEGACAGVAQPSANPAPMRLFHLSIAYLTLLFAVIAVTSLLPVGQLVGATRPPQPFSWCHPRG